jgi:hypothetical protein
VSWQQPDWAGPAPVLQEAQHGNDRGSGVSHSQPFVFYTERHLVVLTGIQARTLSQLVAGVKDVPGSSIFYHTHRLFLAHHYVTPLVYNGFALWVEEALQEEALGEKLAAIDLREFTTIRQLRETIIATIRKHVRTTGSRKRICPPGDEFNFCRSKSFIMPMGIVATDVRDFFTKLPSITNTSLYFHFLEARLRLGHATNDFSLWLASEGAPELAQAIDDLDPYVRTLDELKSDILALGHQHGVC